MTTTTEAKDVAVACLQAWTSGDFEQARALLSDDVTFVGPLGRTKGGDEYIAGVRQMAGSLDGVRISKVVAEGNDVCVRYDLVTKQAGGIPTVGWYELRDGKIAGVTAFFDPRPLLG
jgi:limonene-1,2-epoxide hydrolase